MRLVSTGVLVWQYFPVFAFLHQNRPGSSGEEENFGGGGRQNLREIVDMPIRDVGLARPVALCENAVAVSEAVLLR